ncbi:MAG: hypothetical protein KF709_02585 [Gemmatimonadaceae bacterium]|nr:hypothetical protein [Gemmatimonadaceae bacterium]
MSQSRETKRQQLPWPWWRRPIREFVWSFDLDDGTGDGSPSLTKIMALSYAVVGVLSVPLGWTITGTQLTLAVIAISAAFGRSMWRHYLARATFAHATSDTTVRTASTAVSERRDVGAGMEPAP